MQHKISSKPRARFARYGLFFTSVSVGLLTYVRWKWLFENGNTAGTIVGLALIALLVGFIFSLLGLPRMLSILGLLIAAVAVYLLSGPLYAIP